MERSYEQKQQEIIQRFSTLLEKEERYAEIIRSAHFLTPFPASEKKPQNLVKGCQSELYVLASYSDNKIFYTADSDSLISKGLAGLLCYAYSGEDPKTILLCPPRFLQVIDVFSSLSMNRSNGLKSLFSQMQKLAIPFIN